MADKVTADMVGNSRMSLISAVDSQGAYRNIFRCDEYPELTKVMYGPKRRHPMKQEKPRMSFAVKGVPIEGTDFQAIADAINAYRDRPRGE